MLVLDFLNKINVKQSSNLKILEAIRPQASSAKVVLATFLLEEVELLEGLKSVHV